MHAAVLRLPKHFDFNPEKYPELAKILIALQAQKMAGPDFLGIPYEKIKLWADFKLREGRIKAVREKNYEDLSIQTTDN